MVRLIQASSRAPNLARQILRHSVACTRDQMKWVVIGNDYVASRCLAFNLDALSAKLTTVESYTLTELAWPLAGARALGRKEYAALLVQEGNVTRRDMRRAKVSLTQMPKTAALLQQSLHGEMPTPSPATRTIRSLADRLEAHGTTPIDTLMEEIAGFSAQLLEPYRIAQEDRLGFVFVISNRMTDGERHVLSTYLQKVTPALIARDVWIVLEDSGQAEWLEALLRHEIEVEFELVDALAGEKALPEVRGGVRLGHVAWSPGSLATQVSNIFNLARQMVRDRIPLADLMVVAPSPGLACLVRTELVMRGVPVKCSEGHLLPMRPSILDAISLIAAFHGYGRVPAAARLHRFLDRIHSLWLDDLIELFAGPYLADDIWRITGEWRQPREFLESLRPMQLAVRSSPEQAIEQAWTCLAPVADENSHLDFECHRAALLAWATGFQSVAAMLSAFWRLRGIWVDWQGYRPDSGLEVADYLPQRFGGICVLIAGASDSPIQTNHLVDVYRSPLVEASIP